MSKQKENKEKLFEIFSLNLENILKHFHLNITDKNLSGNYICPLSFKLFSREGLNEKYKDQLTIEHTPPESVGGKGLCLTSKLFNNKSGSKLDKSLEEKVIIEKINNGEIPLHGNAYFGENTSMKVEFILSEKSLFKFKFYHKTKNIEKVLQEFQAPLVNEINFKFSHKSYWKYFTVSMLRTAYLLGFSHIGYSLLFGITNPINHNYSKIREQIDNPEKHIFDKFIILTKGIENINNPINIITEPIELRSLLIVIELKQTTTTLKFGVILPGPDDYGTDAITFANEYLKSNNIINFKFISLNKLILEEFDDSMAYHRIWEEIHGITKKNA